MHKSLFGESVAVEAVEAAAVTTTNDVQPTRSRKLPIAKLLAAAKLASSASSVRNYSADTTFPPSDDPLPNPNARAAILDVAGFSESELVTPRSQQAESVETVVDTARDGQPQPAVPSGDLLANIESY